MFSPFERMVARRYLGSRKAEGFVSVIAAFSFLGIMLGVATLIIVMSVMNGFREELFSKILGLNGHITIVSTGGPLYDYDYLKTRVEPLNGVASATPMIEAQSLLTRGGGATGVMVRGITPEDFMNRPALKNAVVSGALDNFNGNRVAIGSALADKFGVKPGDSITLLSPQVKSTPFGSMPRQRAYEVAFIFDVGMREYNAGFIFMPLDTAQVFFQLPNAATMIEVFLKDPENLDDMRAAITTTVKGQARVFDWRDTNQSFYNALQVERNVMFLILTLMIAIAAFNILSSMIMLVKDKSHDIAIMRTMGATRQNILKIFMLTGASIGISGTVAGAAAGISFALNIESIRRFLEGLLKVNLFNEEIYFLSKLPAIVDWYQVVLILLISVGLSVFFTLYPALRASRLDPVEALRYE
jgi:lipoprotein-releasing system permease protein